MDPAEIYHNQTCILDWLAKLGHRVDRSRDPTVRWAFYAPPSMSIGKRCPYCGDVMTRHGPRKPTKEHVHVPKSRGGVLIGRNRLIVCATCNHQKGDRTLAQFAADLEYRKDYHRLRLVRAVLMQHAVDEIVSRPSRSTVALDDSGLVR